MAACAVLRAAAVLAILATGAPAAAQGPAADPPGPFVFDIRGAFGRGLGIDVGAHVYTSRVGSSRLGLGAALLTFPSNVDVEAGPLLGSGASNGITALSPQVSFNFGASTGWSYLSAGVGRGKVGEAPWGSALNAGGGARWFLTDHAAFGFDLRYHRLRDDAVFAISAGVGLK